MIELFEDIPEKTLKQAEFVFDMAIKSSTLLSAVNVLKNYTESCSNEREQEFVEFYFKMRMAELTNE